MNDCNDSSLRIFYHSICNHISQYKLNLSPPSLALCNLVPIRSIHILLFLSFKNHAKKIKTSKLMRHIQKSSYYESKAVVSAAVFEFRLNTAHTYFILCDASLFLRIVPTTKAYIVWNQDHISPTAYSQYML